MAVTRTGAPVPRAVHSPTLNFSSPAMLLAKRSAVSRSSVERTFTANMPAFSMAAKELLERFRQQSRVGGAAVMEQTAVAVRPLREPSSFKVVIRQTLAARRRMPDLNASGCTVDSLNSPSASGLTNPEHGVDRPVYVDPTASPYCQD